MDTWSGVHKVVDCQPAQFDALGEKLVVLPINLSQGDTKEGREEVHAYCCLQSHKEQSSVGNHSLDIMSFVLHAEGEAGICGLRKLLSNNAEGFHHGHPLLHQPNQPLILLFSAPNKAAKVALPS